MKTSTILNVVLAIALVFLCYKVAVTREKKGSVRKKCVSLQGSYLWSLKNKIENKNCFYEAYTGTNIGNDF